MSLGVQALVTLFLSLFVAIGGLAAGAGVRGRHAFFLLWGLLFGGIPMVMAGLMALTEGVGVWFPLALMIPVAVATFVVGWRMYGAGHITWGRGGAASSTGGWWTSDGGSWGSSGGSWGGGGFDSGGSFGGFDGGSSGGGGASGSW